MTGGRRPVMGVQLGADQRAGGAFRFGGQAGAKTFCHGVQIRCALRSYPNKTFGIAGHGLSPVCDSLMV